MAAGNLYFKTGHVGSDEIAIMECILGEEKGEI